MAAAMLAVAVLAGRAAEGQTDTVRLKVEIAGVAGAEARNVRAVLSIARAEGEKNLTLAHIRQLDRRAQGEIATALEPFGFISRWW